MTLQINNINAVQQIAPVAPRHEQRCSIFKVIKNVAKVAAVVITGMLIAGYGAVSNSGNQPSQHGPIVRVTPCTFRDCPPLPRLKPYESLLGEQSLRFNKIYSDKVLWFAASEDYNGAISPTFPKINNLIKKLDEEYDLKYVQVESFEEICLEIEEAAKLGAIKALFIQAHGMPDSMLLSKSSTLSSDNDFASCFKPTDETSDIILLSCETGMGEFPIAKTIAKKSRRKVTAPEISVAASDLEVKITKGTLSIEFIRNYNDITRRFDQRGNFEKALLASVENGMSAFLQHLLKSNTISDILRGKMVKIAVAKGHHEEIKILLQNGPIAKYHLT